MLTPARTELTITTSVEGGLATSAPGAISNAAPVDSTLHDKNFRLRDAPDAKPLVAELFAGLRDFGPEGFLASSPTG